VAGRATPKHRPDIDGLRAIAVGLVVAYHAGVPFITGGYVGVDVFFVISGFLITGLLVAEVKRSGTISIPRFYARRVRRLLPASALVLVTSTVVAHLLMSPLAAGRVDTDAIASALYVSNWAFAAQTSDYFAAQVNASPLLNYWSLGVEEQFYVVWPLLILGAVALGVPASRRLPLPPQALRRVGLVLALVGISSFAWSALFSASQPGWSYYGLHTRAWELAVGAGLALALPHLQRVPTALREVAAALGLLLIVVAALTFTETTTFPGTAAAVPVLGTALVLGAGAHGSQTAIGRTLSLRGFVHIGLISYSWYLWHWPVLTFVRLLTAGPSVEGATPEAPAWALAFGVALSYVLALGTTRFIENPVRNSAGLASSTGRTLLVGVGLTLLPVVVALAPLPGPAPWAIRQEVTAEVVDAGATALLTSGAKCANPAAGPCAEAKQVLAAAQNTAPKVTPQEASDDVVKDLGLCHQGYDPAPVADPCVFGDPEGTSTIVLMGDSKAQHWFPAINAAAKKNGWKLLVWTKSSCPVANVVIEQAAVRGRYTACEDWRADVEAKIKSLASTEGVDLVLLGRSKNYGANMRDSDGKLLSGDAASAVWAKGLASTRASLGTVGQVAVLQDPPWAPSDRPDCLSAHPTTSSECAFVAYVPVFEQVLLAGEAAAAANDPTLKQLNLTALVCPDDVCLAVSPSGAVVFRDQHHMTATYSASLGSPVGREIKALLAAS